MRVQRRLYARLVPRHAVGAHTLEDARDFPGGMRRRLQQHQVLHLVGIVGHVARQALPVTQAHGQRPVVFFQLGFVGVAGGKQPVKQRDGGLRLPPAVGPQPLAVKLAMGDGRHLDARQRAVLPGKLRNLDLQLLR